MSITDELREYARRWLSPNKGMLLAIADRIDAEHDKAVDVAFANGRTEGIADGCAHYDTEHTECMVSEEHGWVRGPLDADGVLIRFKDKVTVPWSEKVYEVSGFSYQENVHLGTMTIWINVHENGEYKALCAADSCRHYKPPTVEDVLREFGDWYAHTKGGCDEDGIIAEYSAKLQLRGEGE